jgi:hypothetical protein
MTRGGRDGLASRVRAAVQLPDTTAPTRLLPPDAPAVRRAARGAGVMETSDGNWEPPRCCLRDCDELRAYDGLCAKHLEESLANETVTDE